MLYVASVSHPSTHLLVVLRVRYLEEKDLMDKIPFVAQPFDPDESFLDEAIGYGLAAFGFAFQLFNGFALPFPINLIFLPLTIIEWFLRIQISMGGVH